MKLALFSACMLAFCASAQAGAGETTRQSWVDACDLNGSQMAINACVIVESGDANERLDAVVAEIHVTYADNDAAQATAGLAAAQAGWQAQVQSDLDARFPVAEGEDRQVLWGSSYVMQVELLRAMVTRQRIDYLCDAWLPMHTRRRQPVSACAGTTPSTLGTAIPAN